MFTKGEWKIDKLSSFRYIIYPDGKDNSYTIAEINSGVSCHTKIVPNEGEANARLIAQAPKLYEALKGLQMMFEQLYPDFLSPNNKRQMDEAIAPVEGK